MLVTTWFIDEHNPEENYDQSELLSTGTQITFKIDNCTYSGRIIMYDFDGERYIIETTNGRMFGIPKHGSFHDIQSDYRSVLPQ